MDNSPFGRLSPELRNRIYEMVLDPLRCVTMDLTNATTIHDIRHPLIVTCRQIKAEAKAMSYSRTAIDFELTLTWSPDWLVARQKRGRNMIRWLQIVGLESCRVLCSIDIFISLEGFRRWKKGQEDLERWVEVYDNVLDTGPIEGGTEWTKRVGDTLCNMGVELCFAESQPPGDWGTAFFVVASASAAREGGMTAEEHYEKTGRVEEARRMD